MEALARQEQQVDRFIKDGQQRSAVELLYELIVAYAKAKDFAKAESLRERLMRVDDLALSEIVNSAEIIEEEKAVAIDPYQRGLWKNLYNSLTAEERNAFYYAVKHITFNPDQSIIKQGMLNDKLFFVNKGRLKLLCRQGDKENYIKQINMGEVVGYDTFFDISVCTSSVITLSSVKLSYLDRGAIRKLAEQFPGVESKIRDFCFKTGGNISDILQKKEVERRRFTRYKISGRITTQLLDKNAKPVGRPFHGHAEDISEGGVSYFIKCSQEEAARFLLGRPAEIKISFLKSGDNMMAKAEGVIVGVKYRLFNDYTVHLRFSKLFPEQKIIKWSLPS